MVRPVHHWRRPAPPARRMQWSRKTGSTSARNAAVLTFDQRHLLNAQLQYTTGMGLAGGSLFSGWRGTLLKEWTFATLITVGSWLARNSHTALTSERNRHYRLTCGLITPVPPLYSAPSGLFLNPAAYVAPLPGQWGTPAGIPLMVPAQFSLNASLGRTFRLNDRFNLDFAYRFGQCPQPCRLHKLEHHGNQLSIRVATSANSMRSIQTTLRLRF
jgi:hypothetical protein